MESFGTSEGKKPNVENLTPEQKQELEQQAEETAANLDEIERNFVEGQKDLEERVANIVEDNHKKADDV